LLKFFSADFVANGNEKNLINFGSGDQPDSWTFGTASASTRKEREKEISPIQDTAQEVSVKKYEQCKKIWK
jgi:hypothetical protein